MRGERRNYVYGEQKRRKKDEKNKEICRLCAGGMYGVSLLVNVPVGTVSAEEPTEMVVADIAETSEADFEWDGTKITKYKANGADVVMPSRCTEIGDRAFQSKTELKTVEIPDGVKKIGECAFADCRLLKSIVIPDSVTTIGDEAFYYCALLEYAVIPDGVTTIGKRDENRE